MPLSPQKQKERRARLKAQGINPYNKARKPKKIARRHCRNCNGWFLKTRSDKVFCSEPCKKEFHHYGAAYGPLKLKLEKLIDQKVAACMTAVVLELGELRMRLTKAGL